jgi:hypothetical protein
LIWFIWFDLIEMLIYNEKQICLISFVILCVIYSMIWCDKLFSFKWCQSKCGNFIEQQRNFINYSWRNKYCLTCSISSM